MFDSLMVQLKTQTNKVAENISHSQTLSKLSGNLSASTASLSSLKEQTSKVSSNFVSSLKSQSSKVSQLLWHTEAGTEEKNVKPKQKSQPSLLEQLKWPVLINNETHWLPYINNDGDKEEEDIVDRFIRVIQSEDQDENPESTFYNHPSRRRNDREEIRRKLAMGVDDEFSAENRPLRKPSLQSRLQSGMNLQICFMNETASDCESQCSDTESTQDRVDDDTVSTSSCSKATTPQTSQLLGKSQTKLPPGDADQENGEVDFFTRQARLQAEARLALAQAKEMARMQMEIERQNKKKSPIAEIVRESFNKIGIPFPDSKRRISRQILIDMNVAQLQVIVNDLHTQIESLNEDLVNLLMERDDLHMEQDSMLVDIEDLTKHLGAKEGMLRVPKDGSSTSSPSPSTSLRSLQGMSPKTKSRSIKLKGLVKK